MKPAGNVSEFDPKVERWNTYKIRLNSWLIVSKVNDTQKRDYLLAIVGARTVELLVSLATPDDITTKSYDDLIEYLDDYYQASVNAVNESVKFDLRTQLPNEGVREYITAIKELSINCGFGTGEALFNRLRNRLITGVRNSEIRDALLKEAARPDVKLTWEKAKELALAMDCVKAYPIPGNSISVNKVESKNKQYSRPTQQSKPFQDKSKATNNYNCYRCNGHNHAADKCRFKKAKCHNCQKIGHIAKACRTRKVHAVEDTPTEENLYAIEVHAITQSKPEYTVVLQVNGKPITFVVDTASGVTLISEHLYNTTFPNLKMNTCNTRLSAYSGHDISIAGQLENVGIQYNDQHAQDLTLIVVKGNKPALLGRDWLAKIKLDWSTVVYHLRSLEDILSKYEDTVFSADFGKITGHKAKVELKPGAEPKYHKNRTVPYALREKVDQELQRQVDSGVIVPVKNSDWASPIVIVPKSNGSVRICADYKVSVNKQIEDHVYVLPTVEDLLAKLKGERFTKIDLANAFLQLPLDEESQKILTITTPRGLFQPTRLPFGIKTAPLLFQQVMDKILHGLEDVVCYIDDILITAKDDTQHLQTLQEVLKRLSENGIHANKDKCTFMSEEIQYLGYGIKKSGIVPLEDRIQAIVDAPKPSDKSTLMSLLGAVNYYEKFIPNRAHLLAPLYRLLRNDVAWEWTKHCDDAVDAVKSILTSNRLLTHFDPDKDLVLACDASPYGVGCVLSHRVGDSERPIAYASKALTAAEKNYPQIEREALAIIFGTRRFQKYLYGRKFKLITDHKPLTAIFGEKKGIPALAALRLQRWSVLLSAYDYEIVYRKSQDHGNADYLSRHVNLNNVSIQDLESQSNCYSIVTELPLNYKDIATATKSDKVLSRVTDYIQNGWPNSVEQPFDVYQRRKLELSMERGCVLWGTRVVIPEKHISQILEELHAQHFGVVRTKALARSYVWFPGLDGAIEAMIKSCSTCQSVQPDPPVTCRPWFYPDVPWYRLHADLCTFRGTTYLIVVDGHSKWPEALPMLSSTTAAELIHEFQTLFATHGLPAVLVTDNGPQFVAKEFDEFLMNNGIRHLTSPHYHPNSNGQAERTVQTIKSMLKKITAEKGDIHRLLCNHLLTYRNTSHPTTGMSPAELLMKRKLRTRLSLLKPNLVEDIRAKQADHVKDSGREFAPNTIVRVKGTNGAYELGKIVKKLSYGRYLVRVNGRVRYVHLDHIRQTDEVHEDISAYPATFTHDHHTQQAARTPNVPVTAPAPSSPTESTVERTPRNAAPPHRYADYHM